MFTLNFVVPYKGLFVLQLSASEPIELSRIYPTPPSVENNEGEKFDDVKMARLDGSDRLVSGLLWENVRSRMFVEVLHFGFKWLYTELCFPLYIFPEPE